MEGTEEVVAEVVESVPYLREKVDTLESRLAVQTSATEAVFAALAEAGTIDQATAGKYRTIFAAWTSDADGNVWEPGVYGWTENADG